MAQHSNNIALGMPMKLPQTTECKKCTCTLADRALCGVCGLISVLPGGQLRNDHLCNNGLQCFNILHIDVSCPGLAALLCFANDLSGQRAA